MSNHPGAALRALEQPIDMLLFCPQCGQQHVDAPEPAVEHDHGAIEFPAWDNPPHKSHLCHSCGCIWRPADVATNGVQSIKTVGKADTWNTVQAHTPSSPQVAVADEQVAIIRNGAMVFVGCARQYIAAVEHLFSQKGDHVLAELSPTQDQDCFEAFVALNDTGKRLRECCNTLDNLTIPAAPQSAPKAAEPQWQQIETAPKDIVVLVLFSGDCVSSAQWMEHSGPSGGDWYTAIGSSYWLEPTHWMPLPAPPEQRARSLAQAEQAAKGDK